MIGPGLDFVERFGDDAGEALFMAGLAMLDQALARAREGTYGRFRHYPRGELRRLRKDVSRGLTMCRQAAKLQDLVNDELYSLTHDLNEAARAAGARRRRAGTLAAEDARLAKRKT